ncbi:hypothetical protein F4677DRAFT_447708 [Hypoxylon crocopeplum]|nr:hypothetical protein F4677DRAFT_447708 [Hypoxylon crocopeplum]
MLQASLLEAKPDAFLISSCVLILGVALSHGLAFRLQGIPGGRPQVYFANLGEQLKGTALFLFRSLSPSYQFRQRVRKAAPSPSGPWSVQGLSMRALFSTGSQELRERTCIDLVDTR